MKKFTYLFLALFLFPVMGQAQRDVQKDIALKYVQDNATEIGLKAADVENMIITDVVHHKHSGVTSVYFLQSYEGTPIKGATYNVNITKNDEVGFNRTQFLSDVKSRVKHTEASISAEEALNVTAADLHVALTKRASVLKEVSKKHVIYEGLNLSREDIPVKLQYVADENGDLILTWNTAVYMKTNTNSWDVDVNAVTGEIFSKKNMTHYCNLANLDYSRGEATSSCSHPSHNHAATASKAEVDAAAVSGSYRVYAIPAESPNHGTHELVENPHYPEASPFGWHDIQGNGNIQTITRGNNVHAYADLDGNFASAGDEPDGGEALIFDFAHNTDQNGDTNIDAAVVNLFYSNNIVHDILYLYGFTEATGNFQANNYGNGGIGGDEIIAREAVPDDTGAAIWNNASFGTPPDGGNGVMSMGIWESNSSVFRIESPEQIEGPYEVNTAGDDWGHSWTFDQIIEVDREVALARDGDPQSPTQGCGEIINTDEVDGKIVLIDRGLCEFGTKALNAQNAGAIGVIICNVVGVNGGDGEELIGMAPGADGFDVTIPSVFSSKSTCDRIKAAIGAGETVTVTMSTELDTGPSTFNSAFDNGVVFHEYGHGFNGRFLGGPNNAGGLGNAEQMGEGWSDFFAIAFSARDTDTGDIPRGVGTYLLGQSTNGRGIRTFPYSTDFNLSPYTYDDIIGTNEVHAIGQVWTAMIWDVFWYYVDTYGFDNDWANQDSGNGRAMRIIMDGVGFVGSSPGFVDARDAILFADEENFDGQHVCDLWQIFARRGLGYFADQGSPNDSNDGVEDFEPLPTCIQELKVRKTIGSVVLPGEQMQVILDIANHTLQDETNVVVTDMLADGLSYVAGSSTGVEPTVNGNMISFNIGDMATLDEERITYEVVADASIVSPSLFYDSVEGLQGGWDIEFIQGNNIFNPTSLESNSPEFSWGVETLDEETEQALIYKGIEIEGDNPVLRFWTKYNTVLAADGGFVELSNDEGVTWNRPDDRYILGGPNAEMAYGTFAIPALQTFTGFQEEWVAAYLDVSNFAGQSIWVRWRFGSDDTAVQGTGLNADATSTSFFPGWYIDDLQLLDIREYDTQVCISSDAIDESCNDVFTVLVDSELTTTAVNDLSEDGYTMNLVPNPASEIVTVQIGSVISESAVLELKTVDGKVISSQRVDILDSDTSINIDVNTLTAGFYFVSLQSRDKVLTKKLMVN